MAQHYTRDTIEVSEYCRKCGKSTPHTVSDRRLGYCIPCYNKPQPVKAPKPEAIQAEMFGGKPE